MENRTAAKSSVIKYVLIAIVLAAIFYRGVQNKKAQEELANSPEIQKNLLNNNGDLAEKIADDEQRP